jgi:hypothetical protein
MTAKKPEKKTVKERIKAGQPAGANYCPICFGPWHNSCPTLKRKR